MSSFNANSQNYNIQTETELSEILSHYSSEFVFSIVDSAMKSRYSSMPIVDVPNVVSAWEQNFKAIMANFSNDHEEIMRVRNETYDEIIDMICREFSLNFTIDDSIDKFSAAYHLYDLFVCNFWSYLSSFFANYIYKERNELYESLNLAELKKNKDSSTIYGKKLYKDVKLAVINANIDLVIREIFSMEIPFDMIIGLIFGNSSELKRYYLSIISTTSSFFDNVYKPMLNYEVFPEVVTSIRFKLHELAVAHDQMNNNTDTIGG